MHWCDCDKIINKSLVNSYEMYTTYTLYTFIISLYSVLPHIYSQILGRFIYMFVIVHTKFPFRKCMHKHVLLHTLLKPLAVTLQQMPFVVMTEFRYHEQLTCS